MSDAPQEPNGKQGRQPRGSVTPADYDIIGRLWAEGKSYRRIAARYGVDEKTIRNVMNNHVWPAIQHSPARKIQAELHKISVVESRAWEAYMSNAPAETREVVNKVLKDAGEQGQTSKELVDVITKTSVHKNHQTAYLEIVLKCIEMRCKLEGHYAPKRIQIEGDDSLRVAGMTPDQVIDERFARLNRVLIDRLKYEAQQRGENVVEGLLITEEMQ